MKKIYILEHFDFNSKQIKKINSLGDVTYFEKENEQTNKLMKL